MKKFILAVLMVMALVLTFGCTSSVEEEIVGYTYDIENGEQVRKENIKSYSIEVTENLIIGEFAINDERVIFICEKISENDVDGTVNFSGTADYMSKEYLFDIMITDEVNLTGIMYDEGKNVEFGFVISEE